MKLAQRLGDNRFEDVLVAAEAVDFSGTRYSFLGNHVAADWFGAYLYDMCLGPSASCGVVDSAFTVAANRFETTGVYVDGTLGTRVRCGVIGNDFGATVSPDVFLGANTHDCIVIGTADVEDHGTNNHVIP